MQSYSNIMEADIYLDQQPRYLSNVQKGKTKEEKKQGKEENVSQRSDTLALLTHMCIYNKMSRVCSVTFQSCRSLSLIYISVTVSTSEK